MIFDHNNRPMTGGSGQNAAHPVLAVVLEGRKLSFGADQRIIRQIPLETRRLALQTIRELLLPELPCTRL